MLICTCCYQCVCLFFVTKTTRKFKDVRVKIDGRINVGTEKCTNNGKMKKKKKIG